MKLINYFNMDKVCKHQFHCRCMRSECSQNHYADCLKKITVPNKSKIQEVMEEFKNKSADLIKGRLSPVYYDHWFESKLHEMYEAGEKNAKTKIIQNIESGNIEATMIPDSVYKCIYNKGRESAIKEFKDNSKEQECDDRSNIKPGGVYKLCKNYPSCTCNSYPLPKDFERINKMLKEKTV